ncbi:MAG: phosphatase PAP2 family protein [Roseburia sp.]
MKKNVKRKFGITGVLFVLFILFTIVVANVDVQAIGPEGSEVGLATVNQAVFQSIGVHPVWETITDWFGYLAIIIAGFFAILGLAQFVKEKSLFRVDQDILLLGLFYVLVVVAYVFFEVVVVNCRPVILDVKEGLEASYPSSHTMLVVCIMSTAMMQFGSRIKPKTWRTFLEILSGIIIVVTVVGRLVSGVHWFTDIVGGLLLSATLIMLYDSAIAFVKSKACERKKGIQS